MAFDKIIAFNVSEYIVGITCHFGIGLESTPSMARRFDSLTSLTSVDMNAIAENMVEE